MDILIWALFIVFIATGIRRDSRLQCKQEEEYFKNDTEENQNERL